VPPEPVESIEDIVICPESKSEARFEQSAGLDSDDTGAVFWGASAMRYFVYKEELDEAPRVGLYSWNVCDREEREQSLYIYL